MRSNSTRKNSCIDWRWRAASSSRTCSGTPLIVICTGMAASCHQRWLYNSHYAWGTVLPTACQPRVGRGGRPESPEQARRRGLVDIALCRAGLGRRLGQADRGPLEDRRRGAHRLPDAGRGGGFGRDAAGRCGRVGFAVRAVRALDRAPRPWWPGWGRVSPAIRPASAWQGAWPRPARRRMRSWRRDAGKRPGWSRSIRARRRRDARRNGWRRRIQKVQSGRMIALTKASSSAAGGIGMSGGNGDQFN